MIMNNRQNRKSPSVLVRYNNQIKKGLRNGIRFTKLIDQVNTTKDPVKLLKAIQQLVSYQLDTKYVEFPHQFGSVNYYLVFMNRLLAIHDLTDRLEISSKGPIFYQTASGLGKRDYFKYSLDLQAQSEGGAYYQDTHYRENLFYINLGRRILRFNGHALTKLLVVHFYNQISLGKIKLLMNTWLSFAKFLEKDYNFNVDFDILNSDNHRFYKFKVDKLSTGVMDKLFIIAAKNHYMLKSYRHGGAQLKLSSDIVINIFPNSNQHWGLEVKDSNQAYSWLDVLLKYSFIRKWYLNNLDQLLLH